MASATIGNPTEHATKMIGMPVLPIADSGAPCGNREILVYNPPIVNQELGIRQSYLKAAVKLTCDLLRAEVTTLVFGQSRTGVEVMLKYLREAMKSEPLEPDAVMGYRGGYLPAERRQIEQRLRDGEIKCVVATSALELGIDIGSLDAVVRGVSGQLSCFVAEVWTCRTAPVWLLAVLVTSSAPLDQFFALSPSRLVDERVESARIDPNNTEILVQHVKCAAFELPFHSEDNFGVIEPEALEDVLKFLTHNEVLMKLRKVKDGSIIGRGEAYPASHISLRSIGWDNFVIVDIEPDRVLAEMDWRSAHTMLHEQAIYQHDGNQYQVERLDFENRKAYVRKIKPDYFTTAQTHTNVTVTQVDEHQMLLLDSGVRVEWGLGEISVVDKVVGFKKIRFQTHENVGFGEVNLPVMQMHTTACWVTLPEFHYLSAVAAAGWWMR